MKRMFLAAGAAALAIAVPAMAEKGGQGGDKGGGKAAKVERGGGGGHAAKAEHRGGGQHAKAERRGGELGAKGGGQERQKLNRAEFKGKADKAEQRSVARVDRSEFRGKAKNDQKDFDRANDIRIANGTAVRMNDWEDRDDFWTQRWANGYEGCPPGHSKVPGICMPYGQYKKMQGGLLPASYRDSLVPAFLRDMYRDDDDYYYRYGDGFIYRVDRDRNLIESLIPLFGGGLMLGQPFPASYSNFAFPSYYQPFYQDTPDDYYRYANGYAYEIDRDTGLIEDIVPLYDRGYGVGQLMPASYSYYNLPYPYRGMYADNNDYYYRYAPGAIYQVDRKTQLVSAIASLLTGNNSLAVGQPLPMGYDAYNVPYAYRDRYYDTADNWYRYNNGNIYQVDPTTRLITAVIDAIV